MATAEFLVLSARVPGPTCLISLYLSVESFEQVPYSTAGERRSDA